MDVFGDGRVVSQNLAVVPEDIVEKKEVLFPPSLFQTPLVDAGGNIWMIEERIKKIFGIWSSRQYRLGRFAVGFGDSLKAIIRLVIEKICRVWIEKDVRPATDMLRNAAVPLLNECVTLGGRQFRRAFMEKLGAHGERIWTKILEEQFDEIGSIWKRKQEKDEGGILASGLLPPQTRFWWQWMSGGKTVTLFCLESPPQKRVITLLGTRRHLAFPWIYFFIRFEDNAFRMLHAFYRGSRLQGGGDMLYFPNLPNVYPGPPFSVCLGQNRPTIKLSDPLWCDTLLGWFWDSSFRSDGANTMDIWETSCRTIPEVASAQHWADFSKKDPDAVTKLSWLSTGKSLDAFVSISRDIKSDVVPSAKEDLGRRERGLISRFRTQLEEEFHFLAGHFGVPVDVHDAAVQFLQKHTAELAEGVTKALDARCSVAIGDEVQACIGDNIRLSNAVKGGLV